MLKSRWPRESEDALPAARRGVNEFLIVLLSWVLIVAGAFVLCKGVEAFKYSVAAKQIQGSRG